MAKSEKHAIHVWQAVESLVYQRAGRRENDFAISIKTGQEPTECEKLQENRCVLALNWCNIKAVMYHIQPASGKAF